MNRPWRNHRWQALSVLLLHSQKERLHACVGGRRIDLTMKESFTIMRSKLPLLILLSGILCAGQSVLTTPNVGTQ